MIFLADEPARKEGETPVVRGDLYGTRVEWPERQPMYSLPLIMEGGRG
jgi:hypothetical protein